MHNDLLFRLYEHGIAVFCGQPVPLRVIGIVGDLAEAYGHDPEQLRMAPGMAPCLDAPVGMVTRMVAAWDLASSQTWHDEIVSALGEVEAPLRWLHGPDTGRSSLWAFRHLHPAHAADVEQHMWFGSGSPIDTADYWRVLHMVQQTGLEVDALDGVPGWEHLAGHHQALAALCRDAADGDRQAAIDCTELLRELEGRFK